MICNNLIEGSMLFFTCAGCEGIVCASCAKIAPQLAIAINAGQIPGFQWTCAGCTKTLPSIRNMEKTLNEIKDKNEVRMTQLEAKIDGVMNEIHNTVENKIRDEMPKLQATVEQSVTDSIRGKLNEMESTMDTLVADKMKSIDAKIKILESQKEDVQQQIKQAVEDTVKEKRPEEGANIYTPDSPNTHMKKTVASVTAELKDREERKKNLILHNVPEPDTNVKTERIKADKEFFLKMCNKTLGAEIKMEDIKRTERFGEKNQEKPRPLWFSLSSENAKRSVFSKLAKLQDSEYDSISINHDMTKIEREQKNKLTEEAKQLEKSDKEGKFRYRVRGPPWDMKIVKIPKKTETTANLTEASVQITKNQE